VRAVSRSCGQCERIHSPMAPRASHCPTQQERCTRRSSMRRAPATHIDAAEASPKTCAIEIAGAQDEALGPDGAPVPKRTRRRPGDPPAPPKPRRAREARAGTLPAGAAAAGGRPRGAPGAAAAAAAASAQRRLAAAAAGAAALPPPRRALLTAMQWRSSVGRAGLHALAAAAPCAPRTRCHPLSSTDACDGLALFQASGLFLLSAVRDSVTPSCAGPSLLAEAVPPVTRACGRADARAAGGGRGGRGRPPCAPGCGRLHRPGAPGMCACAACVTQASSDKGLDRLNVDPCPYNSV